MRTFFRLSRLVAPLFPVMALAVAFGSAGFFCAIGIPVFGAAALVSSFPVKFLLLAGVLRGILHYFEQYCNHFIAFTLLARIRNIVFEKLRKLGPAKIETKEKGSLISLITSDIELLEVFYAHTISPVCIAFIVSAGMAAFFLRYSWILALVAVFFYIVVGFFIPLCMSKSAAKAGSEHREQFSKMNSFLLDSLRGISMSIMYGTGGKKLLELRGKSDELTQSQRKMAVSEGVDGAVSGFFVVFGAISMLFFSLFLHGRNLVGFDCVVVCTAAMFSSFGPVIAVANLGAGLSQTLAAGKRVLALLDEKPAVETIENGAEIKCFTGAKMKGVCFSYKQASALGGVEARSVGGAEWNGAEAMERERNLGTPAGAKRRTPEREKIEKIIENFSADFPKGKIIGIQGKSGSGKSTLLKLFMRFYEADAGTVGVSGEDVNKISTSSLRKAECFVTQETVLFHDTIENNIRIAKLDATRGEIEAACKKANVHDFICSLPQKYETPVSELGDNFSGGERQRFALARAFLHGGDFILLDEPTSNLDSYNEKIIMDAVKAESSGKTVIVVSHRGSTFAVADSVIKLESARKS